MNHTYLVKEGVWKIVGTFHNQIIQSVPVKGEIHILHQEEEWLKCSRVQVISKQPFWFTMNYTIQPFAPLSDTTTWHCVNTLAGSFTGEYLMQRDQLVCRYHPPKQGIFVEEIVCKQDDQTYLISGLCSQGEREIASWTAVLEAVYSYESFANLASDPIGQ